MPNWYDITRNPDYQSLSEADRLDVKRTFFNETIGKNPEFHSLDENGKQATWMEFMQSPDDTGQGQITSTLGAVGRGFGEVIPGAIQGFGALAGIKPFERAGEAVRGGLQAISPVNPLYEDTMLSKGAGVAGQIGSVLATAGIGGAVGKGLAAQRIAAAAEPALAASQAISRGANLASYGSAALQGAASGAQTADQYGLTGAERYGNILAGAAGEVGSEMLPFGLGAETALAKRILTKAPQAGGLLGDVATESLEEGANQLWQNAALQALAPAGTKTPGLGEGVLEAMGYGALGGGLLGGVNVAAGAYRKVPQAAQNQLESSVEGVINNADVAPLTAQVLANESPNATPSGSFVPGDTETEEIPGIGAINRADLARIPPAEPPFANEPPSPESLVGDAGEVIPTIEPDNLQDALDAHTSSAKTPEQDWQFAVSMPEGIWIEDGLGGRMRKKIHRIRKSGSEEIEFEHQILNEETGEWEDNPSAYAFMSKAKDGSLAVNNKFPSPLRPVRYTDISTGERRIAKPVVVLPKEAAAAQEVEQGKAALEQGKIPTTEESSLVAPEDEAFAAQRRADLLAGAADAASGKVKAPVSPVVTAMVTPQPQTTQTNALQKQSTGSVLQREQKETRKTGSERERVEPSLQGQEAAGARQGEEKPVKKTTEELRSELASMPQKADRDSEVGTLSIIEANRAAEYGSLSREGRDLNNEYVIWANPFSEEAFAYRKSNGEVAYKAKLADIQSKVEDWKKKAGEARFIRQRIELRDRINEAKPAPQIFRKSETTEGVPLGGSISPSDLGTDGAAAEEKVITPQGKPTTATVGKVMPGGSATLKISELKTIPEDWKQAQEDQKANNERWQKAIQSKEPIRVIPYKGGYRVSDGHHRLLNAKSKGETSIEAIVEPPLAEKGLLHGTTGKVTEKITKHAEKLADSLQEGDVVETSDGTDTARYKVVVEDNTRSLRQIDQNDDVMKLKGRKDLANPVRQGQLGQIKANPNSKDALQIIARGRVIRAGTEVKPKREVGETDSSGAPKLNPNAPDLEKQLISRARHMALGMTWDAQKGQNGDWTHPSGKDALELSEVNQPSSDQVNAIFNDLVVNDYGRPDLKKKAASNKNQREGRQNNKKTPSVTISPQDQPNLARVATERDLTKLEQRTPEEMVAHVAFYQSIEYNKKLVPLERELMAIQEEVERKKIPGIKIGRESIDVSGNKNHPLAIKAMDVANKISHLNITSPQGGQFIGKRGWSDVSTQSYHIGILKEAIQNHLPVSAKAVDDYKITLPKGYELNKAKDLYVFNPQITSQTTSSQAAQSHTFFEDVILDKATKLLIKAFPVPNEDVTQYARRDTRTNKYIAEVEKAQKKPLQNAASIFSKELGRQISEKDAMRIAMVISAWQLNHPQDVLDYTPPHTLKRAWEALQEASQISPQTTAAENQTAASSAKEAAAAGVVQSETGKGSILPDDETKETPYKEESRGKVEHLVLDDVMMKLYGLRGGVPTKDAQSVLQQVIDATSPIKGLSAQFARALLSKFPSLNGTMVVSLQQFKNAMASLLYNNGKHGFSQEESFSAVDDFLNKNSIAFYDPFFDAVVLPDGKEIGPSVTAHEIGHAIEDKLFKDASEKTKSAIIDAFNKYIARVEKQPIVTDYLPLFEMWYGMDKARPYSPDMPIDLASTVDMEYLKSFKEWFANQVAKWATSYEKPLSLVDKFFSSVASKIKELFNLVKGYFSPETSVVDYIHSLATSDMRSDIFLPKKKKQVKKQSFFDKMVPDSMRGNAPQAAESPTSEKAKATGYAEKLNSVRKLLRTGSNSAKAQNESLALLKAMPVGDLQDAFNVLTGDTTKLTNRTQLANNILNEILAQEKSEMAPTVAGVFSQAEQEMEQERKAQAKLTESRRNYLDSIIGKPQEVEMDAVSVGDGRESLAMVHNSGDVPGVLNAFVGTSKDFLANPENEKNFPGLYRLLKGGRVDEGNFAYGRAFVFTDGIGINAADRANAAKLGVTPAIAAVRRVLIHESLVHRGIFGLPAHLQRKILQWVQQNTTPEQLDVLAKTYPQYADWRSNENQLLALCEEFLAKKVEKLTTIPKTGPLARLMDILSDIWRWITGNTGEPTIKNLKDVVKLLKAGAEAADARLVNGGKIKMSQLRAQGFVTPEMDKAYMDAVEAGDMEKAQRMVDEAAKAANVTYVAKVPIARLSYGELPGVGEERKLSDGNAQPLIVERTGAGDTLALADGYHRLEGMILNGETEVTVIILNSEDSDSVSGLGEQKQFRRIQEEHAGESADPVTRDDAGNVIPLSQRFNAATPDIRASRPTYANPIDAQLANAAERMRAMREREAAPPVPKALERLFDVNAQPTGTANKLFQLGQEAPVEEIQQESAIEPQAIRNEIRAAYDRAMVGESSIQVPIQKVFDEAKGAIPSLTERDFGKQLQNLYEDGSAFLVPTDRSADMIAAGEKWGVYDAAGMPASYVGIMPAQESPIIYATPIDRNAIQTQVEESAKAPINEDSLKSFLLRAIAMHGQPSSVRMARLDPDAPLQVSAQSNGELVIGLGVRQAGEVIRNSRSTQAGFKYLADAVEEEMIHFADLLAMRSKWEAQGKQIDFDTFIHRQSMDLTMDLMQTAETLSIADKEALRKALAANLASYSNNPNWNNDTLENVLQAYAESPMKMNAELVRSLIQAKRSGEITATGYQRIANTIVKWLQDALNWLKQSYNQARGGTFGNVLARRIQDVEGQLDALGASANIKASRIGDDVINRQKTDLQKQRITGEQVAYQGYPLTNSQGDPIAITRTQQAYKPRAELARQFVKEVADSLDDITQLPNEVINDSYLRAIGAEYMGDFQTLMLAEAENLLRERAKAETIPEEKQRLNQAVEQAAAFFRQGATQGGLDLNTIKQVQKDPRFAGMFALDTVKTQKKEDQAAVVEPNFNGGYAEGMGALNDEAFTEAINDLEKELQDRLDQSWLEKAEATLPEKARLLLAKVRGWLADKAKLLQKIALARSALFLKQSKTKQSVAANAAANPFDSMTVAQVEAEIARMEKEVIKLDKKIGDALESIGDELFDSGDVDSKTSGKEKAERMARTPRKETLLKPGKMTALQRLLDKTRDGWSWKQIFTMPKAGQERRRADMLKKVQENEAFKDLNDDEKAQLVELLDQAWIDRRATYLGQKLKADKTVRLPWVTNKGAAKKLESATPELLKAFNDGTFNKDTFNTILAKKYGVKPIDEKAMERAEQLAEELQDPDLPEPVYARKADELLKLIADTQQLNWAKMLNDAWVASVLAGPRTFFDIGFAALNGLQRVMVESTGLALHGDFKTPAQALSRFISVLPQGLKEAAYFIKTGDVSILSNSKHQFARFLSKGLKGGGNHSSTSYQLANWNKDKASDATAAQKLQGKILRTIGRFMQMVERILTALDHINSTATKYAYLPLAIAQNKKKYADARLPNAQEMEQFRNQAKAYLLEGREPANFGEQTALDAWTRHFSDKFYAHAQDIVEGASYAAGVSSGTVDPEGIVGALYDNILAMASRATSAADELKLKAKALLKDPEVFRSDAYTKYALATLGQLAAYSARNLLGFRFIRFGANKLNDSLSYIPGIGLFRLAEKENDNATKSQMIWNNQAFGILLMMAGIYAIHAMEDEEDPEKRGFDLQGSWDGLSAEQKKQLSDSGKKEYTITFYRNGKPITLAYKTWPISAMLSAIGTMTDMVKFKREKWDQKQFADRLVAATAIAATSTLDSAALSQFADLVGKSAYQADPDEAFVKRITRVGTNFAGGFVPRVFKDLDYWLLDDKARKYETVWENLGKEVPIYRQHIGGEKLNIFAEPIRTSRSPWSRAVIESPSDEAYRKLGLLNARDIWLTPASPEMRTIGTKNRRRHLTPEEQNRYIKLVGAGYKKIIEQYGDRAISMPKERAKAFIADKTRDVRDRAEKLATRPQ